MSAGADAHQWKVEPSDRSLARHPTRGVIQFSDGVLETLRSPLVGQRPDGGFKVRRSFESLAIQGPRWATCHHFESGAEGLIGGDCRGSSRVRRLQGRGESSCQCPRLCGGVALPESTCGVVGTRQRSIMIDVEHSPAPSARRRGSSRSTPVTVTCALSSYAGQWRTTISFRGF